jgi:protocatechuate 3,4-dioxygenase beta subunit
MHHDDHHEHEGLAQDLKTMAIDRRRILQLLAGAGLAPLVGCGSALSNAPAAGSGGSSSGVAGSAADTAGSSSTGSCAKIPEETAGPYPGDGSNGPNVLNLSGIVRSDIRSSFDSLSGTAAGIPLRIKLNLVDVKAGCSTLPGAAIYLWHCDRDGKYSLYTVTNQNYLRGIQETDDDGSVTFTSIFPACYSGRWPHIHFEIYPSLADAMSVGNKLATSQLALPVAACNAVFATDGYSQSVANLKQVSLTSDMVFRDGTTLQIPTVTGNVTDGYQITLTVGVNV